MLGKWIRFLLWQPFAVFCRRFPLWSFRAEVTEPVDGVRCIRIDNLLTRALSRFSGGYDYAVLFLVDGTLLIDTGFPWARRRLKKLLSELDARESIDTVVNTHYHEDHTGNNDLIADECGAKIYAHAIAVPEIKFPEDMRWYRSFLFGPPPVSNVEPIGQSIRTPNYRFEPLETPGHCPGHICLWEPTQRWLFSGDLYVAADLDAQLQDAAGPDWIESLKKAIDLRPAAMFDAHGTVFLGEEDVRLHLERKLAFLIAIGDRVAKYATEGTPIQQLTAKVFDRSELVDWLSFSDGWLSLITGSDFSRAHIVKSFLRDK